MLMAIQQAPGNGRRDIFLSWPQGYYHLFLNRETIQDWTWSLLNIKTWAEDIKNSNAPFSSPVIRKCLLLKVLLQPLPQELKVQCWF